MKNIVFEPNTIYYCSHNDYGSNKYGDIILLGIQNFTVAIVALELEGMPGWSGASYPNNLNSYEIETINKAYSEGRLPGEVTDFRYGNCHISNLQLVRAEPVSSLETVIRELKGELNGTN